MENSTSVEDQCPIIWYQLNADLDETEISIKENRSLYLFYVFEDALKFSQSLNMSFLLILPNYFQNEEQLLKEFESLKDTYSRRLTNFEEESVFAGLSDTTLLEKSFKVYAFFTREDFENEVLANEKVQIQMEKYDVKEAAFSFRQECEFWERHKGKLNSHPKTLKLPPMEINKEDFRRCQEFCIRSLKELARKRKKEKIRVIYYMNLAESCQVLGKFQEAVEYSEIVLLIVRNIYGERHASMASAYRTLASAYYQLGNYQKALECNEKTLDIRKVVYGEGEANHLTLALYQSAALYCQKLGESQKAIENMIKAVDIGKSVYGETHVETLKSIECLANMYASLGDYEKALRHLMEAFEIKNLIDGNIFVETHTFVYKVAATYERLKEYRKALKYHFKYLDIIKSIFGEIHQETQAAYLSIVRAYVNLEEDEKALEYTEKFLEIKVALQGKMHAEIAHCYQHVAEGYEDLGNYQKAFHYHLKSIEIKRVVNGEDHQMTEEAYESLGAAYAVLEKSQKEFIENKKSLIMRFEEFANGNFMEDNGNLDNKVLTDKINDVVYCSLTNEMRREEEFTEMMPDSELGEGLSGSFSPKKSQKEANLLGKRVPFNEDYGAESEPDIEKKLKQ